MIKSAELSSSCVILAQARPRPIFQNQVRNHDTLMANLSNQKTIRLIATTALAVFTITACSAGFSDSRSPQYVNPLTGDAQYQQLKSSAYQLRGSPKGSEKEVVARFSRLIDFCLTHDAPDLASEQFREAKKQLDRSLEIRFILDLADVFVKDKKDDGLTDSLGVVINAYNQSIFDLQNKVSERHAEIDNAMVSFVTRLISNGMTRSADVLSTEIVVSLFERQQEDDAIAAANAWISAYRSIGDLESARFVAWQVSQLFSEDTLYVRSLRTLASQCGRKGHIEHSLATGLLQRTTSSIQYATLTPQDRFHYLLAAHCGTPYAREMIRRAAETEDFDLCNNYMLLIDAKWNSHHDQSVDDKLSQHAIEAVKRSRPWYERMNVDRVANEEKYPGDSKLDRIAALVGGELKEKTGTLFPYAKQSEKDWMFTPPADFAFDGDKIALRKRDSNEFRQLEYDALVKTYGGINRPDISGWIKITSYAIKCGRFDLAKFNVDEIVYLVARRAESPHPIKANIENDKRLFEKFADEMISIKSDKGMLLLLQSPLFKKGDISLSRLVERMIEAHMYSAADLLQAEIMCESLRKTPATTSLANRAVEDWQNAYKAQGDIEVAGEVGHQWDLLKSGKMNVRTLDSLLRRCRTISTYDPPAARELFTESLKQFDYEKLSVSDKELLLDCAPGFATPEFISFAVEHSGYELRLMSRLVLYADRRQRNEELQAKITDTAVKALEKAMISLKREFLPKYVDIVKADSRLLLDLIVSAQTCTEERQPREFPAEILADKLVRMGRAKDAKQLLDDWSSCLKTNTPAPGELDSYGLAYSEFLRLGKHLSRD